VLQATAIGLKGKGGSTMTDTKTLRTHRETLIQTELGTYFIVDEDLLTGEVMSLRISVEEAYGFQEIAKSRNRPEVELPRFRER
jgi:hypothetical protein